MAITAQTQVHSAPGIELVSPEPDLGDRMGYSVSIDGDYAVVGTRLDNTNSLSNSGSVEIFKLDPNDEWQHHQTLFSPEIGAQHRFGHAVGVSGDFLIVGEEKNNTGGFRAGAAHLFKRDINDNIWKFTATTPYGLTRDSAGRSVAIEKNAYIVGVLNDDSHGLNAGTALVAEFGSSGLVGATHYLSPLDVSAGDNVGNAVSISGDYAVVGAFRDDDTAAGSGSAYVFYRDSALGWTQVEKLVAADPAVEDQFGFSVSISGSGVAVGSRLADSATDNQVGAVYIYEGIDTDNNGSLDSWPQVQKLMASGGIAGDRLGTSVAIDGDRLVAGAPERDEFGMDAGVVYYYKRNILGIWEEQNPIYDSETTTRDNFGISVSLDTNNLRVLVGSWLDNRPQNNSGAAYLFGELGYYQIGDTGPAGGIVYYTDGSGGGLEASPLNQARVPWGCYGTNIQGADGRALGDGQQNTIDILAPGCGENSAAAEASSYTGPDGETTGWFLPSRDELNLLYEQKLVIGGFVPGTYWSSSEFLDENRAYSQFFDIGTQAGSYKYSSLWVRAVRAF